MIEVTLERYRATCFRCAPGQEEILMKDYNTALRS